MLRPISPEEAAVVERALRIAPTRSNLELLIPSIQSLTVTSLCGCGCATVWFGPNGNATNGQLIADGIAHAGGEHVQVLVWMDEGKIAGLEIVGFSESPAPLPDLDSVTGYGD